MMNKFKSIALILLTGILLISAQPPPPKSGIYLASPGNPTATLLVNGDTKNITACIGESIEITVDGTDDEGVWYIYYWHGVKSGWNWVGQWENHTCTEKPTSCSHTWTRSETEAGTYYYWGYVYDNDSNGAWSIPDSIKVEVTDCEICDDDSYTTCEDAYPMTDGEVKPDMCGDQQFYKITMPGCDMEWELTPYSDYDLYVTWDGSCPSQDVYDCKPSEGPGTAESCTETSLPQGTYYAMVHESISGTYNIQVELSNCVTTTSLTSTISTTLTSSTSTLMTSTSTTTTSTSTTTTSTSTTTTSTSTIPTSSTYTVILHSGLNRISLPLKPSTDVIPATASPIKTTNSILGSASTSSTSTVTTSTTTTTTSSTTTTIAEYTAQTIVEDSGASFLLRFFKDDINEYGDFYDPSLTFADFNIDEGDVLLIDVPETTEITFTGTALDSSVTFSAGKNWFVLPLKPSIPYIASTLAEKIGATTISKWDPLLQEEVTFNIVTPLDNDFLIEGAQAYIAEVPEGKTIPFEGTQWSD